jgi:hypothetical protein
MADFKSGARKSSVPNRAPPTLKASLAKAITDTEGEAAAAYFSSIKPRSIVSVIETDTVPKTYVTGLHLAVMKNGEKEPLALRFQVRHPRGDWQRPHECLRGKARRRGHACACCLRSFLLLKRLKLMGTLLL